jgi:hypothetical protein
MNFVSVSGKHAMRLLRAGRTHQRSGRRPARRLYNEALREALIVLWEASDRVCGKRLRALVPILVEAIERHGHLQLTAEVRTGLQTMSAATIDRALRQAREPRAGGQRRHAPPSAAVRRSVAVRTFDGWDDPPPRFVALGSIRLAIDNLQTHDERVDVDTGCLRNSIWHFDGGLSQYSKNALSIYAADAMLLEQPTG